MDILKQLNKSIKESQPLKQFISNLQKLSETFHTKKPQQIATSKQHQQICYNMQNLKLLDLQTIFDKLPPIPQITAIIIKKSSNFTLAFLMIPENRYFGWHDHCKMNGISKIVGGNLFIKSINPQHLQKCNQTNQNIYYYPIDRIREQKLTTSGQNISIIYPDSYNIHEIYAHKQSSFLDLLIPEYPDGNCHYFKTCQEPIIQGQVQDKIKIMKINESYEDIIGLEGLAKWFTKMERQKEKQKQKLRLQQKQKETLTQKEKQREKEKSIRQQNGCKNN